MYFGVEASMHSGTIYFRGLVLQRSTMNYTN